jgi:hypothetical protein
MAPAPFVLFRFLALHAWSMTAKGGRVVELPSSGSS